MKSEDRIVEILSKMFIQNDKTNAKLDEVVKPMDKQKKQQAKTNIELSDMRLSLMQIAGRLEVTAEFDKRISRFEDKVLH